LKREQHPEANIVVPTVVNLTPSDLPAILKKLFADVFIPKHIKKLWTNVGFVPFTKNVLENKKCRSELGQSDPTEKLERLAQDYAEIKEKLKNEDFNHAAFDASIPEVFIIKRKKQKKNKLRVLLQIRLFSHAPGYSFIQEICSLQVMPL